MPAIITNDMRIRSADSFERTIINNSSYVFIGGTTAWANESYPPDIIDDTVDRISAYKEIIGLKKITSNNIRSVIPRYDWTSGTVYDCYDDSVNVHKLND